MAARGSECGGTAITPMCPRCGYDQSGAVAAWGDRCPLAGVCSECGLEFWWWQVVGERAAGPAWSVEHGERLTLGRLARAYGAAVWQRGLWRRFELHARVRPGRLAAFAVGALGCNHLLLAAALSLSAGVTVLTQVGEFWLDGRVMTWLFPYAAELEVPVGRRASLGLPLGPLSLIVALAYVVPLLVLFVFTQSMSRVGVRMAHVWRGAAYMLPAVAPVIALSAGALAGTAVFLEYVGSPALERVVLPVVGLAVVVGWPLAQVLRWRSFVRHYLRLEHSNWIALSMAVILGLVAAIVFVLAFILLIG